MVSHDEYARVPPPTVVPAPTKRAALDERARGVPSGRDPASQPLVSVASPVPAQWAAYPT